MKTSSNKKFNFLDDKRFNDAVNLFNTQSWYPAHDLFEELWHETQSPEREILQGILQIAVARLHLEKGNTKGATILYGEGLARLKNFLETDLGLDLRQFCECLEQSLKLLQQDSEPEAVSVPCLLKNS